jgi:hypothetical protein
VITGKTASVLADEFDAVPVVTQFGWQEEIRFFSVEEGPTGLMELVGLIGGTEQGLFLPSLSWLAGVRMPDGSEFAVGPNLSISGSAYVIAAGITRQYGSLNFPMNISVVLSKKGLRISFLIGFNAKTTRETDWRY